MWMKLFRFSVLGMALLGLIGLFSGGTTSVSGFTAVQVQVREEQEFFYGLNGQTIPLRIALDQVGVLAQEGVTADQIEALASQLQLTLIGEFPGEIFILGLREPLDRDSLVRFARWQVKKGWEQIVAQAGLVVRSMGSETPMFVSDEFIVQFWPNVNQEEIDALNEANNVEVVMQNPFRDSQFLLKVTGASPGDALTLANGYHQSELTEFAHPNFIVVVIERETIPNDPLFGDQWHHRNTGQSGGTEDADVDTSWAWDITQGGAGVVIAVIDGGFDMTHPDLTPNFWTNPGDPLGDPDGDGDPDDDGNTYTDDIHGWDFTGCNAAAGAGCGDNDPTGGNHGTAVAGAAAARGDNALGVSGSCPNCSLMLIRKGGTVFAHGLAFDYARQMGADIITNSWGYAIGTPATTNVVNAINNAAAAGSVVFFAMTNENDNNCGASPDISSLANVIAVSRSTNQDQFDFSGFGNCMDLLAPSAGCGTTAAGRGTLWATTTDVQGNPGYNNNDPSPCGCPSTEPSPPPANARDYTFCFKGTSFATPLTAGVAGLILSANPGLTRVQVQRLLQDTADKIEDSAGSYATDIGFSSPATGVATHGWGRVNAFEAVRVAAPVEQEGRGGVDIFLRDNRLDWGNTTGYLDGGEQPSNTLFEPTRGFIGHWRSMDIKVDAPPYQTPPTAATFDAFTDETPSAVAGDTNRVYVRVRNRGPVTASSVTVKLHWAQFGTALPSLPSDFWTAFPGNSSDPTSKWNPLSCSIGGSTCTISNLAYSGSSVAGCPGRAAPPCAVDFNVDGDTTDPGESFADNAQIVQFDFPAPPFDPSLPNHFCLLAMIDSPQDRIEDESRARSVVDQITPNDNNVTHRNYHNLDTSRNRGFDRSFFVRNPTHQRVQAVLRLRAPEALEQDWTIELDKFGFDQPFTLQPNEEILVTMKVTIPELNQEGEVTVIQETRIGERLVIGGVTYRFISPEVRPIEPDLPDLIVSIAGPAEARPGQDISELIQLPVQNMGVAPAPGTLDAPTNGYMVDLVLSSDEVLPVEFAVFSPNFHEDVLLQGGRVSRTQTLGPGEARSYPVGAVIPADTPPGDYCLGAVVDPGRKVEEADETNNTACHWIRITPAPSEGALSVSVSTSATQVCGAEYSHELKVAWKVTGGKPPIDVTIEITYPDDSVESVSVSELEGDRTFQLNYPGGGTVGVKVQAQDAGGSSASASASASLSPCQ